jgi:hypothetical protein
MTTTIEERDLQPVRNGKSMRHRFYTMKVAAFLVMAACPRPAGAANDFESKIAPFLNENCTECHGLEKQKGKIKLHEIGSDFSDSATLALWERALEQLEIGEMPPEDEEQPSAREREQIISWITGNLIAAGKEYEITSRLLLPEYGNRVNHELLFDGSIDELPASPSRLWRMSPYLFKGKRYQQGAIAATESKPLTFSTSSSGIRDYASQEIVGESTFLSLMMAFDDMVTAMMHDQHMVSRDDKPKTILGRESFKLISEGEGPPSRNAMVKVIEEEFQRATGRPAGEEELARYLDFMARSIAEAGNESGLKISVMAIYLAPESIYRLELGLGEPDEFGRRMLSPQEIAYAISYALSDKPPLQNSLTREALEHDTLSTREDVASLVRKLLDTPHLAYRGQVPRIQRFFDEFFEHPKSLGVFKDRERGTFERSRFGVAQKLIAEILDEDQQVFEKLLASPRFNQNADKLFQDLEDEHLEKMKRLAGTKAEEEIAKYNRIRKDRAKKWRNETFRAGLLTHPAWLVAHSKCVENDPIHRGKWIRERLLAGNMPALPIEVDAKLPDDHDKTLVQRLEVTEAEECWKCHRLMNPLGTPFEMYDDFGRFRPALYYDRKNEKFIDQEGPLINELKPGDKITAFPVVTKGKLSGTGDPALDGEVTDAVNLAQRLAKSELVRQSIIRHAFRFWMGRNETLSDSKTLIAADRAYVTSGGSFDEVLVSLLTSDSFLYRK